jgi:transposase
MVEVLGYKFRSRNDAEIMAALADGESPRAIAEREGLTVKAIYDRRRNFERVTGVRLKRTCRRGRPLSPLALSAA